MKLKKHTYFLLLSLLAFVCFSTKAFGQVAETSFGGLHLVTLDSEICDCGGNTTYLLDYKTNTVLNLYNDNGNTVMNTKHRLLASISSRIQKIFEGMFYPRAYATSIFYQYYDIYGTYQLGTYSSQSQSCGIDIYDECEYITNMGSYGSMPGTGTTLY